MSAQPTPQFIVQDVGGFHNQDLEKTAARLLQGGSWKKQRIIMLLPSSYMIPAKVALSLMNMAFPPNNGVLRMLCLGMEVGIAYSTAIQNILAHPELQNWEYIFTCEHDNVQPGDAVLRLVDRMEDHPEFAAISGLYFTKGYGGCAQIWGDPKDTAINFRPQVPDPAGGLVECNGIGMGCAMWRLSIFKDPKLRRPWFVTQKKDGVATQDLYACSDMKKHGYRFAVDCSVKVGHLDTETDIVW